MMIKTSYIIGATAIGIGATVCMDLWNLFLRRAFGIPLLTYCLLGRWLGHMPGATFGHTSTLTLPDGRLIFSTRTKDLPVTFTLATNHVIRGVEEGVTGMRVGERRRLLVPASLDDRKFDSSFIPAHAIRHYDIKLLAIHQ